MNVLKLIPKKFYPRLIIYKLFISSLNVLVSYLMKLSLESIYGKKISLMVVFFILFLLVSFYGVIYYFYNILLEKIKKDIIEKLTFLVTKNYLKNKKEKTSTGNIINVVNEDILILGDYLIYGVFPLIDFILMLIIGVVYVMILSPSAAIFYIFVGLIFLLISYKNYKVSLSSRREYQLRDDEHKQYFSDVLKNIPILKVFNILKWVNNRHEFMYNKKYSSYNKLSKAFSTNEALLSGGIYFVQVSSLIAGFILVYNSFVSMPNMISIWNAGVGSIIYVFIDLPGIISYVVREKSSLARIEMYIEDYNDNLEEDNQSIKVSSNDNNLIVGKNITFSYNDYQNVLNNFNFEITRKNINYIIGKNGSGKTTLLKLLLGEEKLREGTIEFKPINEKENIRLSYVPQKNVMFSTSILENISLGNNIDKNYLEKLLEQLDLFELIESLPQKMATVFNDDIGFSEGQLRRLAVIRAIFSKPDYILLDEPFSDLDVENQKRVYNLLQSLLQKGMGIVIITHTFDFVKEGDNVIDLGGVNYEE